MKQYKFLQDDNLFDLEININQLVKEGYQLEQIVQSVISDQYIVVTAVMSKDSAIRFKEMELLN